MERERRKRIEEIILVRQKKPKNVYNDSSVLALAQVKPEVIEDFLNAVSFTGANSKTKHRRVYEYVKAALTDSLTNQQRNDPLFGAVIERVARMTVILDKIENQFFKGMAQMSEEELEKKVGGNYLSYLKEYRNFITSFSDLKWSGDQVNKSKSIEKIKEIQREVTQETQNG